MTAQIRGQRAKFILDLTKEVTNILTQIIHITVRLARDGSCCKEALQL
jgi:hypothetical protein